MKHADGHSPPRLFLSPPPEERPTRKAKLFPSAAPSAVWGWGGGDLVQRNPDVFRIQQPCPTARLRQYWESSLNFHCGTKQQLHYTPRYDQKTEIQAHQFTSPYTPIRLHSKMFIVYSAPKESTYMYSFVLCKSSVNTEHFPVLLSM